VSIPEARREDDNVIDLNSYARLVDAI
jgi:hypothetical protein